MAFDMVNAKYKNGDTVFFFIDILHGIEKGNCLSEWLSHYSLPSWYYPNLLDGYQLELESNAIKARTGFYVKNNIKFKRRTDLEGLNSNLVIIDFEGRGEVSRIINLYREIFLK